MCFQTFEDDRREQSGLEWVECACSRWLHEECIEYDLSVNSRGQELLCPFVYRLSLLSNYVKYKNIWKNIKSKLYFKNVIAVVVVEMVVHKGVESKKNMKNMQSVLEENVYMSVDN